MDKKRIFFSLLFSLVALCISAQTQAVKSLLEEAYRARLVSDYELNIKLLSQARHMEGVEKDPVLFAELYMELSKHYLVQGEYDSAQYYADQNLAIANSTAEPLAQAFAYVSQAVYFNYFDIGDLAVDNAQKALNILEKHEELVLEARAYYILYGVYSRWDDLERTSKYAALTIKQAKAAGDYEMLANAFSANSVVMELHYQNTEESIYLDSMQYYLKKSMQVYQDNPEKVALRTFAIANINMANYFFQYNRSDHVQDSIIHYANIARSVYEPFDKNYDIMGNVDGLLAEVALMQGNAEVAESYLMNSYIHLLEVQDPSYYTLYNVAQGLSNLHSKQGDFEKALFYQKKKEEFNQKIFDETEMMQTRRLEAQYENKRLLSDIRESKQKAQSRRTQLFMLAGLCILLIVSLFLLRIFFRNKHRLQLERNLRLQQQKEDMERQSQLRLKVEKEEQARLLTEQKLLSVQMDQMQKEAMADALQIERKNRLLLQLKEKLKNLETSDNAGFIDRMIKEEMRLEEIVEQSAKQFKNIHPDFFQKLKDQSEDRLSSLELKHCAYIHLGLSTKEIAAAFHIEPKSVRVSKYRIKQKLKLDKEVELDRYLQDLI